MRLVIVNITAFLILKLVWLISPSALTVEEIIGSLALPAGTQAALAMPWTLLTYSFIHVDFWHLLVNCLWLAWFGALLAEIAGRRWLLAAFVSGGIGGALCFQLFTDAFNPGSEASLLGSSAAVFSVITATLVCAPRKKVTLALIGAFSLRSIAAVGMILFFLASLEMEPSQTAAHIGGIVAGAAGAFVWRRRARKSMEAMKSMARNRLEQMSLIEKVNRDGYASLTRSEQLRLFNLSSGNAPVRRNTPSR